MEEQRKFVRIEWPIVIHYKTIEEPITEDQIVGKNISEGGVCFVVYERLAKGTMLDMEIQIPFYSMPIFVKGLIVWIRKLGEENAQTFEVGVSFIEVDPRDQKRFKTYINEEIRRRKSESQ